MTICPNHQIEFAPSFQKNTQRYYKKYNDICLSENTTYCEVIRPYTKKKPYIDLDGQLDINTPEEEFNIIDNRICNSLKKDDRAVRSASQYNYIDPKGNGIPKHKLSYHMIYINEVIEGTIKCKEYIKQVKMPEIINDLKGIIECKWKERENIKETDNILYADNSVYSNGIQLLRTINAYKINEPNRIMKKICGTDEDHITQYLSGDEKKVDINIPQENKKRETTKIKTSIKASSGGETLPSPEDDRITVFLEHLGNPRVDYYEIYLKVGSCLAHNGAKYKTFEKWSNSINIPNRTESDYDAWRSWERQSKKIPFAVAEDVLKREKPIEYAKYMKKIYNIDLILNNEDFDKGIDVVGNKLFPVVKNNIKYHELSKPYKWYVYDKMKGLWDNYVNINFIISRLLTECIDFKLKKLNDKVDKDKKDDKLDNEIIKVKGYYKWKDKHVTSIIKHLQPLLSDKNFHNKLNINLGYLAFKNGLYDIENDILRDYKYDDFVSITLPFDYTKERNEHHLRWILDTLMKICNNNKSHLDFYLCVIAVAILGYADRIQEFYVLYGAQGSNGKSKIFEILCNILYHYCKKSNNDLLEADNKQIHKSLAELKNARIVWINELPKKKKLNAELAKNIRDGTKLRYRVMYGTEDSLDVTFKLFCMTNHEPKFDADGGMDRSFKQMTFNSHFHSKYEEDDYEKLHFKQSNTIDKDFEERKMELLHLLFDYAREYLKTGELQPFPIEWEQDTNEVIEDNDRFKQFFNERITIDKGNKLSWKCVCESYFGTSDGSKKKWIRKQMKRMGQTWLKDQYHGSVKSLDKGGWENISLNKMNGICFLQDMGVEDIN